MKKELIITILAIILLATSCKDDPEDCNTNCLISEETLIDNGTTIETIQYQYDSNQNLISKTKEIIGTATINESYTYDSNNFLIRYQKTYSNGFNQESLYTNDENGRLISEEFYNFGTYATTYLYSYDPSGNLISKESFNQELNTYSQFFEYIYNDDLLVEENWYESNGGSLQSSRTYEYNSDDLLILESLYLTNSTQTIEYTYNDSGQLIFRNSYDDGVQTDCAEMEYDECGLRTKQTECSTDVIGERTLVFSYLCD